jgi:hypothetical protein
MKKKLLSLLFLFTIINFVNSNNTIVPYVNLFNQSKKIHKFCINNLAYKYVISLNDDDSKLVKFQLYDIYTGELKKTIKGTWMLRDEGIYGPAPTLTISWTGVNTGIQDLKFTAIYSGNGKLQSLMDYENRIWNSCEN